MIRSVAGHPQPDLICRESALVVVELPGLGPVGAKVRWSVGNKAGGRWAQRLDEGQLAVALGEEPGGQAIQVTAA